MSGGRGGGHQPRADPCPVTREGLATDSHVSHTRPLLWGARAIRFRSTAARLILLTSAANMSLLLPASAPNSQQINQLGGTGASRLPHQMCIQVPRRGPPNLEPGEAGAAGLAWAGLHLPLSGRDKGAGREQGCHLQGWFSSRRLGTSREPAAVLPGPSPGETPTALVSPLGLFVDVWRPPWFTESRKWLTKL